MKYIDNFYAKSIKNIMKIGNKIATKRDKYNV